MFVWLCVEELPSNHINACKNCCILVGDLEQYPLNLAK